MAITFTELRRKAQLFFPDANSIESGWLQKVLPFDAELLNGVRNSRHASRLLRNSVSEHYRLIVPERDSLKPQQQWLLLVTGKQRELAKRLGTAACASYIRTAVTRVAVAQLREYLGVEAYLEAVRGPADDEPFAVTGVSSDTFDQAVAQEQVGRYITAHGIALLGQTLDGDDPFFALRMRFAFSPACWNMRPGGLQVDQAQLVTHVVRLTQASADVN